MQESTHNILHLNIDRFIACYNAAEFVYSCMITLGKLLNFSFMYSYLVIGVARQKFEISIDMNLASGVDITLFSIILPEASLQ